MLLLLPVLVMGKVSKKTPVVSLSPEQEARFEYYFYAAKSSIENEQFDLALMQLLFCEQINPQDGVTKDYLGMIYEVLGHNEKATDYYRQAYTYNEEELWKHYAAALMKQSDTIPAKEQKRLLKQIVAITEQAAKARPKEAERWDILRQVYLRIPAIKKALYAQDKIDALVGYNAYSAINRYQIYVIANKPKQAVKAVNDYLAIDPTNLRFLLFRIELLEYIGATTSERIKAYQDIIRIEPNNPTILNNYAYLLATSGGDLKEAERMSQRTIIDYPDNPTFLDTYAWILHLQGQDSLAVFYIRKALENVQSPADKAIIEEHYHAILH